MKRNFASEARRSEKLGGDDHGVAPGQPEPEVSFRNAVALFMTSSDGSRCPLFGYKMKRYGLLAASRESRRRLACWTETSASFSPCSTSVGACQVGTCGRMLIS